MGKQRVDQRAAGAARRGVDDHAGGFVDHHQVAVLEHDVERDLLGRDMALRGRGQRDLDHIALRHPGARRQHSPPQGHRPRLDQPHQP